MFAVREAICYELTNSFHAPKWELQIILEQGFLIMGGFTWVILFS